jgi:hypothetical protein
MRSNSACVRLLLIATVFASAQNSPSEKDTASVEGTVTNSLTGDPVARAHVVFVGGIDGPARKYGAITTAEGKFSIRAVTPASYYAQVSGMDSPRRRSWLD